MKFDSLKNDKGVAGLTILLSLVTMLFVIGLLVFIFVLMGSEFKDTNSLKASDTETDLLQAGVTINETGVNLTSCASKTEGTITGLTAINDSAETIASGNWTTIDCGVYYTGIAGFPNNSLWNITYTYTYAGTGWEVINDTSAGIGSVTDWYDIFIVIGAMVVLILLTVIIITSIRGSGLMSGGSSKTGNVGSA